MFDIFALYAKGHQRSLYGHCSWFKRTNIEYIFFFRHVPSLNMRFYIGQMMIDTQTPLRLSSSR